MTHFSEYSLIQFQEKFLKDFKSIDEYFEYPKYTKETTFETDSFEEMFQYIIGEQGRPFTFYFEKDSLNRIKQGIIQINSDGSICLALSVDSKDEEYGIQLLKTNFPEFSIYVSNNLPLPSSLEFLFE